jgi:hypothetical protein
MRPGFMVLVLIAVNLVGCQPSKVASTPTTLLAHQHTWGNYVVEYDEMAGADYSFHAHFEDDGNGNQAEVVNLTIDGKSHELRFRSGTVSVNGVDYGTIQEGDRVKLAANGKVFVNRIVRKP